MPILLHSSVVFIFLITFHVELVKAHHSIVHQLDEGLDLSDETFEEFLIFLILKFLTLGVLRAIIE